MVSGKRKMTASLAASTLVLGLLGAGAVVAAPTAAQAAPGNPGVPSDPVVLFEENFENRAPGSNVLLTDYVGTTGMTYTGDPAWVDRALCNGFILDHGSARVPGDCNGPAGTETAGQGTYNTLAALPYALGVLADAANPAANAAAASFTSGDPGANLVQFRTQEPLSLATDDRFVTFSVDAVAVNCFTTHPELRFYLEDGAGVETPVSDTAIDPCTDPRSSTVTVPRQDGTTTTATGGTFAADSSVLVGGGTLGVIMRNENPSGGGNDGAYDNIRVLDVTPQLDKAFSPATVSVGDSSTLTFTVTNTSELAAKNGWSFTDALPAGLEVANIPNLGGTCDATTTAAAGATSIEVTDGNLAAGEESCTITVDVTSWLAGDYVNGPDNVTTVGLNPPGESPVEFTELPTPAVCTPTEIRATERFWFFGTNGAIDFGTSGTAAEAFVGERTTVEGSTVVTDASGALQFWSNGQEVFDRNGDPMPNGSGLLGNPSATQTVAAFPALGQPGMFFVVTTSTDVGTAPNGSLTYSMVDMTLNDGLGAVTDVKNVPLGAAGTASEAITAVPNADGTGFWVLTYTNNSPNVLAYEFDANGPVTGEPVTSVMPTNNFNGYGSLAFNAQYSQLVAMSAQFASSGGTGAEGILPAVVRVLEFNAETGQVFERYEWQTPTTAGSGGMGYNAEFSPDGRYVYATKIFGDGQLYRYDLQGALTGADVKATEEALGTIGTSGGQVKRAPDGKMYVANRGEASLSVVNAPNAADPGFVTAGFELPAGSSSMFGLPQTVTGCPPPVPALDIEKSSNFTEDSRVGDTVTYTVVVTNTGSADFTSDNPAVMFDDLAGVLDDAAYNEDAEAAASDESEIPEPAFLEPSHVSWAGPLAAGESVTITYTVTLNGDGDGVTRNVAWVPTTPPPPGEVPPTPACDPADADGNDPVTGEPCAVVESDLPRLSVEKTSDVADLPADGGVVTYQVTITNEGPGVYTEDAPATASDDLSGVLDDATFNEITAPESGAVFDEDAQELTWSGPLGAGESVTVEYSVTYDENAGDNVLLNVACIPAGEVVPGSEPCADVRIPAAELDITKTADPADGTTVAAGQELTYTISFASVGQIPAVVDSIDDLSDVFDDATLVDGSLSVSNEALTATLDGDQLSITGEVPNDETYTVSYTVVVNAYADQDNHRLGNVVTRPDGTCGSEECPTTEHPVRHLSLEKTATPTQDVLPGDVVEYTVTVTNDGEGDYTAEVPAVISDDMTDVIDDAAYNGDVAVVASDGSDAPVATFEDGILGWSGPLAAGESVTITYTVTVTNLGDHDLVNTVSPVCGEGEICDPPPPAVEILLPHVVPGKSSDPASGEDVVAGDVVTYTLSWTNDGQVTGPVDATDDLSDVLDDADLTGEPVVDEAHAESVEAVFDGEEQTIRVTGDIAVGETVTVTYQVTVKADGERGDNIAGNVLTPDVPPTECVVEECDPFVPPTTEHRVSEIVDSKSVNPESGTDVEPGQELTYTLTFENIGEAAGMVDRVDDLTHVLDDADVTVTPAVSDEALMVSEVADGRFSITGELQPGQSVTVAYTVTVKAADQLGDATLGNFLLDPNTPPPAEPTCEEGAEDCTTNTIPNIIDSKSVNPESGTTVHPGQELTYTLTFQNIGSAAGAVDRVDDLSHVLDDADVTAQPAASDDALVVSQIEDNRFSIAGELAPGQTVTVVYTVTVKDAADMGDAQLANFLVDTEEEPPAEPEPDECEGSEDCTINPASKIVDSKSVDPASSTSITAGQELTYTLTFTNDGTAAGSVDRVDDLTHVLDDADVTTQPTASDPSLAVSAIENNRFSITGELQPGQTVTVTYAATVKAADVLGDAQVANFLLNPGEQPPAEPTCGDGEDCTFNPVSDVTVTKTADPDNGTAVKDGQEVTYALTFVNDGQGAEAIDFTDHMDGVLDDADLTQAPTASHDALTVSDVADGSFSVSGELAAGQTVTVTYAVKVRDWAKQGDHSLGNVVTVTGQSPPMECVDSALCTEHPVEAPPAPVEPQDPPLAATGSDIASIALLSALGLLVLGGGALLLIRRRQAAEHGSDTP
jgi:uncharacterized repeat protein (TIGR01451 family)/fimbrial isopeptide formation D2 family protein